MNNAVLEIVMLGGNQYWWNLIIDGYYLLEPFSFDKYYQRKGDTIRAGKRAAKKLNLNITRIDESLIYPNLHEEERIAT
jgi:hypothetical protein